MPESQRHSLCRGALVLGVTAIIACDRVPTQPDSGSAPRSVPALRSLDGGSSELGPVYLPVPATNTDDAADLHWMNTGMHVPQFTSYIVTVRGQVTVSPNPAVVACFPGYPPPYGMEGSYGPMGNVAGWRELKVYANHSSAMGAQTIWMNGSDTEVRSDTLFAWYDGDIWVARSGIYALIGGGPSGCHAGFYSLTSAQTISVTTLAGQELVIAPKSVLVKRGTVVRFTAKSRGELVGWPNWRFVPKDTGTSSTGDCGIQGANPCDVTVNNNGILRISKDVQGRMRGDEATVRVYTTFGLVADRNTVPPGDTVAFTPMIDGAAGDASRWRWVGDDSTVVDDPCAGIVEHACLYSPLTAGRMWAYTSLATGEGDSASARVTLGDDGDGGGCGSSFNRGPTSGKLRPSRSLSCEDTSGTLTVSASCSPSVLTRADTVSCVAHVTPRKAFRLVEKRAVLSNYRVADSSGGNLQIGRWTVADSDRVDFAAGDSVVWRGPVVENTQVTFTVTSMSAGAPRVSGSASFTVQPRQWPRFALPASLPPVTYRAGAPLSNGYPGIDVSPPSNTNTQRDRIPRGSIGANTHGFRSIAAMATTGLEGPNALLVYVGQPPALDSEQVFITVALDTADAFYKRQDSSAAKAGEPSPAPYSRYCVSSDLDTLRVQTLKHEGALAGYATNHHTVAVQYYKDHDVMQALENIWVPDEDPAIGRFGTDLWRSMELNQFFRAYKAEQERVVDVQTNGPAPIYEPQCKLRP